ncbi:MAG: hypothetical protein ACK46X_03340 [Candidatus Sericytochromatia bacterium]
MTNQPQPWSRWVFPAAIAIFVLSTLAFPIHQVLVTGGYLYYANGFDESTYLQYDFSQAAQGVLRPGQFLVTLLHQLGLSGGWINALLDLTAVLAFGLLSRQGFRRLGFSDERADLAAVGLVVVPMLVLASNPAVRLASDWIVTSGAIYWLNLPEAYTSALVRSPEPQLSLVLLATATYVALRLRAFWPLYVAMPFMYPFVALPVAFVTLACHLRQRWPAAAARTVSWAPLLVSLLTLGLAARLYYAFLVAEKVRLLLVASYLPLISFTGLAALAAYALLRTRIEPQHRFFALAAASAPLVASNHQLISGTIAQPDNVEQYVGGLAVALVVALAVRLTKRGAWTIVLAGVVLWSYSSYVTFRVNQANTARVPLTPALVQALKDDARHVVVDDVVLTSLLGMVHPRQDSTALGFEKTFSIVADRHAPVYRCIKRQVLTEHPGHAGLARALEYLDGAYTYGSQNYVRVHINRRSTFTPLQDVSAEGCVTPHLRPLRYFLAN